MMMQRTASNRLAAPYDLIAGVELWLRIHFASHRDFVHSIEDDHVEGLVLPACREHLAIGCSRAGAPLQGL